MCTILIVYHSQAGHTQNVLFVSAGNDGTGALNNMERICTGYQFKKVYNPVMARGEIDRETLIRCDELGKTIAAGCKEGIY